MAKKSTFGKEPDRLKRLLSFGLQEEDADKEASATASLEQIMEKPGGEIGRYELLSILGEGGMGIVYLAEQKEPIKRQVALKVIKPGMDTKRVIARFEAERQALALLDHPNIAHVYDAGTTGAGRPYFVMEYVKGLPITEFCDRHRLTVEERLNLFVQVCQAVQHAHQKAIIHRDIKPSNILVSMQDEKAVPKIIDFGVAKALSQPLTERTLATEETQLLGTPEYMSPEQAVLANEDVDTRSDIYSLGVLLYVLLTGVLPFDPESLRKGGIDHIRRIIRDTDPKTPSTRLSSLGEEANKAANNRRTEVIALTKRLHKELEWIPLKAMRKDRTERYRSASELADDIENYLNGAPLIAGPPGTLYRMKKSVRRHKAIIVGTLAVLLVSLIGTVVSTIFAIGQARARAESQAINDFLTDELLASTNPFGGDFPEMTVISLIDRISTSLEDKFEDRPLVKASILHSLGKAYWWQSKPNEAVVSLEQALNIYQQKLSEKNLKALESMFVLGLAYREQGRDEQAQSSYYKALEGLCYLSGENDELGFGALNELSQLGIEQYRSGAYEKACATLTSVDNFYDKFDRNTHVSVIAFLAMALHQLGRKQEAQGTFNQLLGLLESRGSAIADFILATPTILSANINSSANDSFPCISADGLSLYFASNRTTGLGGHDLYVATRKTKSDDWGEPMNLGPTVNSSYDELLSCISPDGLLLYFNSTRPGGSYSGWWDAWVVRRETLEDNWGEPINLGPIINGPGGAGVTHISDDGLSLLFASWQDRPGGYGWCDGWLVKRATRDDDWEEPVNLGPPINTSSSEHCTGVSADELVMFFSSGCLGPARPGGAGGGDLWISTRSGKDEPWREPLNLGPTVNTYADELSPHISTDGSTLYFCAGRHGGFGNIDLWQVSLVPIVDTNGNGKIDIEDLCNLAQKQFHNE
jgi:serine/threonine protein kinase